MQKTYSFAATSSQKEQRYEKQEPRHEDSEKVKPVKSFRSGAISVSIWENEALGNDGVPTNYKSVTFERRYKDKAGNWKSSNSLRTQDLPRATLILQKAYEYLVLTESNDEEY